MLYILSSVQHCTKYYEATQWKVDYTWCTEMVLKSTSKKSMQTNYKVHAVDYPRTLWDAWRKEIGVMLDVII